MTGVDHVGSVSQHHRVVGLTIVGALFIGPLAGGVVAVSFGLAQAALPSALFALVILAAVIFDGAYIEHQKAETTYPNLGELNVEHKGDGTTAMISMDTAKRRFVLVPSIILINREPQRVVLRLRLRRQLANATETLGARLDCGWEDDWAILSRAWEGVKSEEPVAHSTQSSRVDQRANHLSGELTLEPADVMSGHAEFDLLLTQEWGGVLDETADPHLEVIDILSNRSRRIW